MKITAIILAGGKSSRMGEDKGLMIFNEKPMIQHIIDVAKPLVDETIIISNNTAYEQFNCPVFEDLIKDKGPLAGIYTGLMHSKTAKNLILSCDVPFVNEPLLKTLIANCKDVDVVIPKKDNRTHQLIGVYDKSCASSFKTAINNNELKIKLAIEKLNLKIIKFDEMNSKIFNNINAKNDITA